MGGSRALSHIYLASMLLRKEGSQRKRRRDQSACEDTDEQLRAKERRSNAHDNPPEFWNALSKVKLTRRALRELDRRTRERTTTSGSAAAKRSTRLLRSDTTQLLCVAKNGGPVLNHLRGHAMLSRSATCKSKSSSRKAERTRDSGLPRSETTKKTGTTGPYDSNFQQKLIDRKIYPDGYEDVDGNVQEPANIDTLRQLLSISRRSLSPSRFPDHAFNDFKRANRRAVSESKVMSTLVPIITGAKDRQFETEENIIFNNVESFDKYLTVAQPDKYYGARPEQVDERVRRDIGQYIIPSTNMSLPVAPNLFFEGKGAAGRPDVAQRQVLYNSAYGARAMFELQNYGRETPMYDGNAYTIGSSYCDGQLKLYATHPQRCAAGGTEYYTTQLRAFVLTDTAESFRQGAAAYRNSRDFTQEHRRQFIAEANNIARSGLVQRLDQGRPRGSGASFASAGASLGSRHICRRTCSLVGQFFGRGD